MGQWLVGQIAIDMFLWPSDLRKIRRTYNEVFGRYPRILFARTFNEKLQRNKLFYRRRNHIVFADKLAVRDYVAGKLGQKVLTRLYWVGTDLRTVDTSVLPHRFVIKANNGSGTNLIVNDRDALDWEGAYQQSLVWLHKDLSVYFAEWHYRWVPPKLFIEEYLDGKDGQPPTDYKFYCFKGRVELIQIVEDRFVSHTECFVDRQFSRLDINSQYPCYDGPLIPPPNFVNMIGMAEILADKEPYLRVDFYDTGRPVFGEITLYPAAGLKQFEPLEIDLKLGALMA